MTSLERTPDKLYQTEKALQAILESASEGFWQVDGQMCTTRVNPQLCAILGCSAEEIIGRPVHEFLQKDSREVLKKHMRLRKKGQSSSYDLTFLKPDGTPVYCHIKGTPLIDEQGEHQGNFAMITDITDRKKAEEMLRESQEKFSLIIESSPMGIFLYRLESDDRLVFMEANPAADRILGVECSRYVGMTVEEAFPPLADTEVPDRYRHVCKTGEAWFSEQIDYRDDRIHGAYEVHAFQTAPGMVAVLFLDITDRKKAEEALKESEAALRSIFRAAPTGIGMVSNRVLIHVNDRICEMIGYSPDELIGQSARILYPTDEDYEFVGREKYAQIREHGTGTVETRWQHKEGAIIDVLLSSTPLDTADFSKGVIFTALDITARNRAEKDKERLEEQLHRSRKLEAVGQLAGGIAHDFNNILTAIIGYADMALEELVEEGPWSEMQEDALQKIRDSGERAATLTHQLLAFSRRQISKPEILDLNHTLDEMGAMLRRLISENIRLEVSTEPHLRFIRADSSQIEQVVLNLVVNARDAMPDGGVLTMETAFVLLDKIYLSTHPEARSGPHVVLSVSDTGIGMDKETIERIFEPFFTTKPSGQGTGLGLATVYGIVKQWGGHISVYSEPGRGTTFRVFYPAVDEPALEEGKKEILNEDLSGTETILLCEDDDAVRKLTVLMLKEAGYEVLEASCGENAVKLSETCTESVDLLVTDVIMPGMNGKKLSGALNERWADLKTLYISGYTSNVISHHGILDEGIEFLEKPFNRTLLLRRIREVLASEEEG